MAELEKPKYQQLKEHIIDIIDSRELKPGEKIWSENELADRFQMSRHTVRQAIGELVNEGWLYRIQGKGTFVAKRCDHKFSQTKTIGVMTTYLNDYIFPAIIRGIDIVLSQQGYNIVLSCTYNEHEKERMCLENFYNRGIDGLIVETTKSALPNPNLDLYRKLNDKGIPILFIHGFYKELDYPYIVEDDTEAGYLAAEHLIDLGHTRIGGIFKADDIQGHYRFAGFRKACQESGLELPDTRILWFSTGEEKDKLEGSDNRLQQLLEECSALICYNDQIAVRVLDRARSIGIIVPDDLSLVSFDDSQLAIASEVKLTTIAHPQEKLGEEAARAILQMIVGEKDYHSLKMKPRLVIRGSTRKFKERMIE